MDLLFVSISSFLTAISMPGFVGEFFIWFSLCFLLKALQEKGILKSILLSYVYGLLLLMITCFWQLPTLAVEIPRILHRYGTFGGIVAFILAATVIGAPPYMIFGILMGVGNKVMKMKGRRFEETFLYPFFVASSYTFMEFTRELGTLSFTGARLSDSLFRNVGLIQIASITGTLGLVFLIVLVNSVIFSMWERHGKTREKLIKTLAMVGFIYMVSSFVSNLIPPDRFPDPVRIVAFQMNLTQEDKYNSSMGEQVERVIDSMESAYASFGNLPDLYVFPEAVFFDDLNFYRDLKEKLIEEVKKCETAIVIGGIVRKNENYNSAIFLKNGEFDYYAKIKLTPFAEILPLPFILGRFSFLRLLGYYSPGKRYNVFNLGKRKFSVQICFESFFPQVSRKFVKNGAQFLVIITNDGWFRYSTALTQHFSKAVFRAVENGKYVLQVANTGITGLVDPHGRILKTLDLNSNEMGLFEVMPNDRITVYTRFGDSLVVIPSIVMILIPLFDLRFRRRWNHGDKSKIRVHASQDSR